MGDWNSDTSVVYPKRERSALADPVPKNTGTPSALDRRKNYVANSNKIIARNSIDSQHFDNEIYNKEADEYDSDCSFSETWRSVASVSNRSSFSIQDNQDDIPDHDNTISPSKSEQPFPEVSVPEPSHEQSIVDALVEHSDPQISPELATKKAPVDVPVFIDKSSSVKEVDTEVESKKADIFTPPANPNPNVSIQLAVETASEKDLPIPGISETSPSSRLNSTASRKSSIGNLTSVGTTNFIIIPSDLTNPGLVDDLLNNGSTAMADDRDITVKLANIKEGMKSLKSKDNQV